MKRLASSMTLAAVAGVTGCRMSAWGSPSEQAPQNGLQVVDITRLRYELASFRIFLFCIGHGPAEHLIGAWNRDTSQAG